MKTLPIALFALSLALPFSAQAQTVGRLTEEQLIQNATGRNICVDGSVVSARYVNDTDNRVAVICGDAAGFAPLVAAGLGGLGGGVAAAAAVGLGVAALAAGGAGSTSDTQ
jgi:hypothetical protein